MIGALGQLIEHPFFVSSVLLTVGIGIAFGPEIRQVWGRIDASEDSPAESTEPHAATGTR